MENVSKAEADFRRRYGHESTCFCVRRWRGRVLVTPRRCTCKKPARPRAGKPTQGEEEE